MSKKEKRSGKAEGTFRPFNPIQACENIVKNYIGKPTIGFGARACYQTFRDNIIMPKPETFNNPEVYYSTLFHELAHSTGHEKRLNRFKNNSSSLSFGSTTYAKEELIAEMTSSFLCNLAGINNQVIDNQASYIASWLKALKNDSKLVIVVTSKAQKAFDYIIGKNNQ